MSACARLSSLGSGRALTLTVFAGSSPAAGKPSGGRLPACAVGAAISATTVVSAATTPRGERSTRVGQLR